MAHITITASNVMGNSREVNVRVTCSFSNEELNKDYIIKPRVKVGRRAQSFPDLVLSQIEAKPKTVAPIVKEQVFSNVGDGFHLEFDSSYELFLKIYP